MMAAVGLGLVLIAVPLYLWRRPRSVVEPVGGEDAQADGGPLDAAPSTVVITEVDAGTNGITLGDARVLECRDPGSRHTPAEACDHLVSFEKSFADAIQQAKDCALPSAGGGTIAYVADVSFSRKRAPVLLTLPRDGRSIKNAKVVAACTTAVKHTLSAASLDGVLHDHTRYKIAISATYPATR
jgi:hypothetical protein